MRTPLVFIDPSCEREEVRSSVEYASLNGPWKFEAVDRQEEISLVLYPESQRDSTISLAFATFEDRNNFIKSLYSKYPVEQIGAGVRLIQSSSKIMEELPYEAAFSKTVRRIRSSFTNIIEKIRDSVRSHKEVRKPQALDEEFSS